MDWVPEMYPEKRIDAGYTIPRPDGQIHFVLQYRSGMYIWKNAVFVQP